MSDERVTYWADRYQDDEDYLARTMERAAYRIEQFAASLPAGYHRHWQLVDAELLRRHAKNVSAEKRTGIAESVTV